MSVENVVLIVSVTNESVVSGKPVRKRRMDVESEEN
jgi:hypothetical protein